MGKQDYFSAQFKNRTLYCHSQSFRIGQCVLSFTDCLSQLIIMIMILAGNINLFKNKMLQINIIFFYHYKI